MANRVGDREINTNYTLKKNKPLRQKRHYTFLTYCPVLSIIWYMKTYIKPLGILVFISIICLSLSLFGQSRLTHREFFSYERFVLTMEILDVVTSKPGSRKDIRAFATYFNEGIYALSNEKYSDALNEFHKARNIWPEYFGTYFLMALTYDRSGNIHKASSFYKEYLNKLEILELGHFPISAPLIHILNVDDMDTYDESKEIIKDYLRSYDIKLDNVKAPLFIAGFVKSAVIILILGILFLVGYYAIWPYLKKQNRLKNPSPGFWICRKCEEENPDLAKECRHCGKLRR